MQNKFISTLKYLLGWPISIVAIFFIVKTILPNLSEVGTQFQNLNYIFIFYALCCFTGFYFLRGGLWYRLIKIYDADIALSHSVLFWGFSELKRYVPGNIWSFLARGAHFSDKGITQKEIAKLLLIEMGLFVVGALLISILSLPFISKYLFPDFGNFWLGIVYISALIGFVVYLFNHKIHKLWEKFSVAENFIHLLIVCTYLLFFGMGAYFAISSFTFLNPQLFFQLAGFFVLSFLIGTLSFITPAGLGVREGIIVFGLSKIISSSAAGFASLLARFFLIISEIIFLGLAFLWYKSKNKYLIQTETWINKNKQLSILILLAIIYIIYFTTISFLRYENYYAGRFDLGNMAQTVWNTTQGRIFTLTNPDGINIQSRLAVHSDFILIFLAPFYAVFQTPKTLLFIQTIILSIGALFVFLISERILTNKNIALSLSIAYLLNPSLQRVNIYDFHAVALATTFLLAAYYFMIKKKYLTFLIFALLAAITKEQVFLIVALFGPVLFLKHNKKLLGSILFFTGVGVFYYLVSIAIPQARGGDHFALSNYSQFGNSPFEIIKNIILSPQDVVSAILTEKKIDYLTKLFLPLSYLSLLFPPVLIYAIPDLLKNLLSTNDNFQQIYYQYTSTITPFIFISAIYGIAVLRKIFPKINLSYLSIHMIIVSVYAAYLFGPLPGSREPNLDMITKPAKEKYILNNYLNNIPKDKKVAASNNIGAHLSNREYIYVLPKGIEVADILIFRTNPTESAPSLEKQLIQIQNLRKDKNYKIVLEEKEVVVFERKSL